MRGSKDEIQLEDKKKVTARIMPDRKDWLNLRQKLAFCINPLNPGGHSPLKFIHE